MDEKEAEKIVFAFEAAYSSAIRSKDAAALCALTVDDVIVMSEWGDIMSGRQLVEQKLTTAFANMPGSLELEIKPQQWRVLSPDVIVSQGVVEKQGWGPGDDRLAYTRVLIRTGDKWLLAAVHVAEPSNSLDPRKQNS